MSLYFSSFHTAVTVAATNNTTIASPITAITTSLTNTSITDPTTNAIATDNNTTTPADETTTTATAAAVADETKSPRRLTIWSLPAEIRNRIYDDVFSDTVFRIVPEGWKLDTGRNQRSDALRAPSELNLFLVSRQVYRESKRSLYAATFWFGKYSMAPFGVSDYPRSRRLWLRSIVLNMSLTENVFESDLDLTASLPCLEHVRMIGYQLQYGYPVYTSMCRFISKPRSYHYQIVITKLFPGWQDTFNQLLAKLSRSPYAELRITEYQETASTAKFFDPLTLVVDNGPSLGQPKHQCPTPWRLAFSFTAGDAYGGHYSEVPLVHF